MSLQSEILSGLDVPNWDESIATVKRTVANALQALDRGIEIKDTRYFNHSFVPDFVLSWPRDPARQRDVFLRLDSSTAFLNRDLDLLGRQAPVLLSLTSEWADESPEPPAAEPATSTLVTEPSAVERFGEASKSPDFGQVVPAALLKGGKGWIDEPVAGTVASAATAFFSGASNHEADTVNQAAPLLAEHLDAAQAGRVLNLGRVVWEATGGEPTQYPVTTDLSGLDDTALRFLLEEGPTDNAAFWRSIGRLVGLERLVNVGVRGGPNLAALVRSNADRLLARTLLVKQTQRTLEDAGPEWAVESGALVLRGSDFLAYLAARRDDLTVAADEARALDLATFRDRTADEQVETVTVVAGDGKRVTIESEDMFDPSTDAVLASVGDLPGTAVASVGLIVSGKHVTCDFTSRSASGHTNAQFDIVSLIERSLPMLWPLTDARDAAEVRLVRDTVSRVGRTATLFDALEQQAVTES
ncbi:hypothetical protein HC251_04750 [Iamia sp. SCSIO 61187]|uniref:hypothetical protein n=1 Tax=Iamia sp. SCSIO 61187 TaxID=2722752 RepID=UPI001C636402|nr:hypothetical protein [Iamia sp. SCSIO 61187]QYG91819.1 hypothetical protein HC251_04750 [Iamia sp. SCSIO 61187]